MRSQRPLLLAGTADTSRTSDLQEKRDLEYPAWRERVTPRTSEKVAVHTATTLVGVLPSRARVCN